MIRILVILCFLLGCDSELPKVPVTCATPMSAVVIDMGPYQSTEPFAASTVRALEVQTDGAFGAPSYWYAEIRYGDGSPALRAAPMATGPFRVDADAPITLVAPVYAVVAEPQFVGDMTVSGVVHVDGLCME